MQFFFESKSRLITPYIRPYRWWSDDEAMTERYSNLSVDHIEKVAGEIGIKLGDIGATPKKGLLP